MNMQHLMLLHMPNEINRRSFVAAVSATVASFVLPPRIANAAPKHPMPRRGVTGSHVLKAKDLEKTPKLIPLFDSIRDIPEIVDGIHCQCGCTNPPEFYSLLSCFEGRGMARDCVICQGQGRLAVRLHKEGKTLDQIRAAIDAKFA
jgi:hypothetical protein